MAQSPFSGIWMVNMRSVLEGSSMNKRIWAVDRIEGEVVVLVSDTSNRIVEVNLKKLPEGMKEKSILHVFERKDQPVWSSAVLDESIEVQKENEAEEIVQDLKKRDPGGDIKV
ncbi:MAG TPA: DUF3006 family protein [Gemmatimonadetes bacterium]|nr:DUF3006 family protein [Gemmatimonadota bacterium]